MSFLGHRHYHLYPRKLYMQGQLQRFDFDAFLVHSRLNSYNFHQFQKINAPVQSQHQNHLWEPEKERKKKRIKFVEELVFEKEAPNCLNSGFKHVTKLQNHNIEDLYGFR